MPPVPRSGPADVAGRWSLTPARDLDPTRRAQASADALLERHGVVTRGSGPVRARSLTGSPSGAFSSTSPSS